MSVHSGPPWTLFKKYSRVQSVFAYLIFQAVSACHAPQTHTASLVILYDLASYPGTHPSSIRHVDNISQS